MLYMEITTTLISIGLERCPDGLCADGKRTQTEEKESAKEAHKTILAQSPRPSASVKIQETTDIRSLSSL